MTGEYDKRLQLLTLFTAFKKCISQGGDPSRGKSIVSTSMLHLYRALWTMPSQDVCLSVRLSVPLSVTRRYSVKTAKDIIKLFSPRVDTPLQYGKFRRQLP